MGTMEKLEEYLDALEEYVFASLSAASPDGLRDTVNQLWIDLTRYGPKIPNIHNVRIPGLGDFEIPPPPPPPPPKSLSEKCYDWVDTHPWTAGGIAAGTLGAGLLVGYGRIYMRAKRARSLKNKAEASERRQVIGTYLPEIFELCLKFGYSCAWWRYAFWTSTHSRSREERIYRDHQCCYF